uniref:Uncharacterized protein n=1 Tax=Panagrellus redivivus TaxID=6233 RepID=A0A7E4UTQ7_PANRE
MIDSSTFVILSCFVTTVACYARPHFLEQKPNCDVTVNTNKEDYDIYSVPGEVYTVTDPLPEALKDDKKKKVPYMKPFYSELPDTATDQITFFGYRDQPDVSFTLVFGDGPEDVSFILAVKQGKLLVNAETTLELPVDFGIGLRFTLNGVFISLVNTYNEKNPVFILQKACMPYRSIPTGISHMAIFTDCASVKFEMINIMFYNQDTEEVKAKRVYDMTGVQNLNPTKEYAYFTMFPNPSMNQSPIYTAYYIHDLTEFSIYGTKKRSVNDLAFCVSRFECYMVWTVRKDGTK